MAPCLLDYKHVKPTTQPEVQNMKAMDYLINLMGHSDEEGETSYNEHFSMMVLTGFLALMVIMVMV